MIYFFKKQLFKNKRNLKRKKAIEESSTRYVLALSNKKMKVQVTTKKSPKVKLLVNLTFIIRKTNLFLENKSKNESESISTVTAKNSTVRWWQIITKVVHQKRSDLFLVIYSLYLLLTKTMITIQN